MSEIAHRRYYKAATIKDADPKDALEAALWEMKQEGDTTEHVIVIRAFYNDEGLHYNISQAGKLDIAQRMGLISLVFNRLTAAD